MATDNTPPSPAASADAAAGLRMLEGYLCWQAETDRAQHDAERFADQLPWLTTAQREDIVRLYRHERLETSRAFVERVADRAQQLQHQYTARYRNLKVRLVGCALAVTITLCVAEWLLPRA